MKHSTLQACVTSALCATSHRQLSPRCARRPIRHRRLLAYAGLLDLLLGGAAGSKVAADEDGEALRAWMQEKGLPPQRLIAAAANGNGRGLYAAQALARGEILLRIPEQLIVTAAAAQRMSSLESLLVAQPLPTWSVLAVWLAEQRALGSSGDWWPYIRLLPEQTGCVLEWSEDQVEWLRGSQLHEDAMTIRAAADASWAELQPLLQQAEAQGLVSQRGAFSREAIQWALSMLLTRMVRLAGRGDEEALVPWGDLLNHSCACDSFLDWSPAEAAVVRGTERQYRAGEEVCISYGQKTSGELLLSYGFLPEPGSNPHDACRLRLHLQQTDPAFAAKEAALQQHGFQASQLFPLCMAAAPVGLLQHAALSAAHVQTEAQAAELAGQLFQNGAFPPGLQEAGLRVVIAACKEALAAYPRSLDADRAELAKLQQQAPVSTGAASDDLLRRKYHVLQVLVYERQVLNRTTFILQQQLKEVQQRARQRA